MQTAREYNDYRALERRIAEFFEPMDEQMGLIRGENEHSSHTVTSPKRMWVLWKGEWRPRFFTRSLDTCVDLIGRVLYLTDDNLLEVTASMTNAGEVLWYCSIDERYGSGLVANPGLALCLAIDDMIVRKYKTSEEG